MITTEPVHTTFGLPLGIIAQAQSVRNPSPYSRHILSNDIVHRAVEPDANGHMHIYTTRILKKQGKLPDWAPARFSKYTDSWICEKTDVDLDSPCPRVRTCSVNMDKRDAMIMHEMQVYERSGSENTDVRAWYNVDVQFGFLPFRKAVEALAVKRAMAAHDNAMHGILHVAEILTSPLCDELLRSGPMRPYPFRRARWLKLVEEASSKADAGDAPYNPSERPERPSLYKRVLSAQPLRWLWTSGGGH